MMMFHSFEKRLLRLEKTLRCESDPGSDELIALVWCGVAYYFGSPARNEKPIAAYARALGYENEDDLLSSLDTDPELSRKIFSAEEKLYTKFGINIREIEPSKFLESLKQMEAGLPASYKEHLKRVVMRAEVGLMWERNHGGGLKAYIRCCA